MWFRADSETIGFNSGFVGLVLGLAAWRSVSIGRSPACFLLFGARILPVGFNGTIAGIVL